MNYLLVTFLIFTLILIIFKEWFVRRRPSPSKIKHLQQRASKHLVLKEWKGVKKQLKLLIDKRLGYPETLYLFIQSLRGLKQFNKALSIIEQELQLFSNDPQLHLFRGKLLLDLKLPNAALESFKLCLPQLTAEEDFLDYLQALIQSYELDHAWSQLAPLLTDNTNQRVSILAGDCQYKKKNYVQAILYYEEAQKEKIHNATTLFHLAQCFIELKQYQKSENILLPLIEKEPNNIEYILSLGRIFEEQEYYSKALDLYQAEGVWEQCHAKVIRQASICALYMKEFKYAEYYLKETLRREEMTPQNLAFLGYTVECQHRWLEAEEIYTYMTEQFSEHPGGYRALAWLFGVGLSQKIDNRTGLYLAHKALELQPDSTSWEILSACEARTGNFNKAHSIQEVLSSQTNDLSIRRQRRHNMRTLRKKIPLNETHVIRILVA